MSSKHLKQRKRKVALVGFSESSRDLAPYRDSEWEIWACNHLYRFIPRADRWFEIHSWEELRIKYEKQNDWEGYQQWMRELPAGQTLYLKEAREDIPQSQTLPIHALKDEFWFTEETYDGTQEGERVHGSRPVFKSTISYMLAMAIMEGFTTIALYGIDMVLDFEWGLQRHNAHFYMGWARGCGIDIIIPKQSALMKEADGMDLYGYDNRIDKYGDLIRMLQDRVARFDKDLITMEAQNEEHIRNMNACRGALRLLDQIAKEGNLTGPKLQAMREANQEQLRREQQANVDLLENMKQLQGHRDEAQFVAQRVGLNHRGEQL